MNDKRKSNEIDITKVIRKTIKAYSKKEIDSSRRDILLTEYKEIIQTLRNWDTLVYGMLTAVGTITAAIITFGSQLNNQISWGIIISLFLFWLFSYIWVTKLAEIRINVLIEIEEELKMIGQYSMLRKTKQVKKFTSWVLLPYIGAFIIGPILGYIISNPEQINLVLQYLMMLLRSK